MSLPYSTSSSSPTSVAVTMNPTQEQEDPVPRKQHKQHDSPRDCILRVGASAGRLCSVANTPSVKEISSSGNHTELVSAMTDVLHDVWKTSRAVEVDLLEAIRYKLELNIKKYPVEHCKGKSGKYTQYSHVTGITQTNQSTGIQRTAVPLRVPQLVAAIPQLADSIGHFAAAREWVPYHTPRNLVLALLGEAGELAELVQWCGDDDDDDDGEDNDEPKPRLPSSVSLDKLAQELADVAIYLLRLATVTDTVSQLCETLQEYDD